MATDRILYGLARRATTEHRDGFVEPARLELLDVLREDGGDLR